MTNNANELDVSSNNQFFSNKDIHYSLKSAMIAVLLHTTVDYYKTSDGQEHFHARFFDKDINEKSIGGMMNMTFANPISMGPSNCGATLKKLAELYPGANSVLDHIADNSLSLSDEEVCKLLAVATKNRFGFNADGLKNNYEQYVSKNIAKFVAKVSDHYPQPVAKSCKQVIPYFENACNEKKNLTANSIQSMA